MKTAGMNEFLAQAYGTGQPSQQEAEKTAAIAEAQLFCKLAADEGIDLTKLSDEQVQEMWNTYKTAAEEEAKKEKDKEPPPPKDDKKKEEEEKKAAAAAEFAKVKEAESKLAEADFIGRVMAHAYVDELKKIATAVAPDGTDKEASKVTEGLRHAGEGAKEMAHRAGELLSGSKAKKLKEHAEMAIRGAQRGGGTKEKWEGLARRYAPAAKEEAGKVLRARIGAGAAAAGAAGAGAAALHHKKEASALDDLAAQSAVVKAAGAGFDVDEASERIAAVITLGLGDSDKLASAQDLEDATEIRAFEILEAAGYPVTW